MKFLFFTSDKNKLFHFALVLKRFFVIIYFLYLISLMNVSLIIKKIVEGLNISVLVSYYRMKLSYH